MTNIIGIIMGLVMFLVLITIHEGGHFLGAKLSGIKVNEFSIGMGPSIFKRQKGETLYSFRALPIGGYVMMEGEEEESSDPRAYENSPAWKRFLTVLAGPMTNYIFAFILFFIIASINGHASTSISEISKNSPAMKAGFEVNDKVLEINGKKVNISQDFTKEISTSNGEVEVKVLRNNEVKIIKVTPEIANNTKLIGIKFGVENSFLSNLKYAWYTTLFMTMMIWESLKGLFTGILGVDQLSGPIGVISQVSQSLNYGFIAYLNFAALISVNLGFFNLIPIPALDGSKLVFNLFEMIFKKPVNKKLEQYISVGGLILLLGLMLFISIKDIIRLF